MPRFTLRFLLLTLFAATPLAAQQPGPDIADRIIAVVGDSIVLKSDIDLMMMQYKQSGQPMPDSAKVYRSMLDNRVNELLLVQAAARDTTIEVEDGQISTMVQQEVDARRRNLGGDTQFQAALLQSGMTMEDLRNMLAHDFRVRMLIREYISSASRTRKPPPVTDADLKQYFEENRAQFGTRQATISFTQVVVTPQATDSARAAARARLEEAMKEIRAGGDFETIARKYTEEPGGKERGGDLGWFRSGAMVREFDQMAFAMRAGDVSPIIETSFGFHIIKVEKVRGAERQARHILVIPTVTAEDAERTRARADSIADKVRAGANPDSIQKAIGDPNEQSRVGPYPMDQLPAPYNTVLTEVQVGAVAGPLLLPSTTNTTKYAIIKVTDRKPAGEYSLDDASFRSRMERAVAENRMLDEVLRELRQRTLVEYRID